MDEKTLNDKELSQEELDTIAGGIIPKRPPKKTIPEEPVGPKVYTDEDFMTDGYDVTVFWHDGWNLPEGCCWASVEFVNTTGFGVGYEIMLQSNMTRYKIVGSDLKMYYDDADIVCRTNVHGTIAPTKERLIYV